MDELLTKEELISGIRRRDKYQRQAKKGAIASAMLAATSAATGKTGAKITKKLGLKSIAHPKTSLATAIATLPALAYTASKANTASKYKKVIGNNKELYKLDQLEYGQLNHR